MKFLCVVLLAFLVVGCSSRSEQIVFQNKTVEVVRVHSSDFHLTQTYQELRVTGKPPIGFPLPQGQWSTERREVAYVRVGDSEVPLSERHILYLPRSAFNENEIKEVAKLLGGAQDRANHGIHALRLGKSSDYDWEFRDPTSGDAAYVSVYGSAWCKVGGYLGEMNEEGDLVLRGLLPEMQGERQLPTPSQLAKFQDKDAKRLADVFRLIDPNTKRRVKAFDPGNNSLANR